MGIGPTTDLARIRKAYAAKTRQLHPEEQQQAFGLLAEAYQEALVYARDHAQRNEQRHGQRRRPQPEREQQAQQTPIPQASTAEATGEAIAELIPALSTLGSPQREDDFAPVAVQPEQGNAAAEQNLHFPRSTTASLATNPAVSRAANPATSNTTPSGPSLDFSAASLASAPPAAAAAQSNSPEPAPTPAPAMSNDQSHTLDFAGLASPNPSAKPDAINAANAGLPALAYPAAAVARAAVTRAAVATAAVASPALAATAAIPPLAAGAECGLDFSCLLQAISRDTELPLPQVQVQEQTWQEQTMQQEQEQRQVLLQRMLALAADQDKRDNEEAWQALLAGRDCTALRLNPVFIVDLGRFCQAHADLPLPLLAELYTIYECHHARARHTRLGRLLHERLGLADEAWAAPPLSSESQDTPDTPGLPAGADIRSLSQQVLAGIQRLAASPRWQAELQTWLLALQTPAFCSLQHQPLFLLALARQLQARPAPPALLTALARMYERNCNCSHPGPVYAPLALQLKTWFHAARALPLPPKNPALHRLLLDSTAVRGLAGLYAEEVLRRLAATAREFRYSEQRKPWDAVFRSPEFLAIRHEAYFLEQVLHFFDLPGLPAVFWPALEDAFRDVLAQNHDLANNPAHDLAHTPQVHPQALPPAAAVEKIRARLELRQDGKALQRQRAPGQTAQRKTAQDQKKQKGLLHLGRNQPWFVRLGLFMLLGFLFLRLPPFAALLVGLVLLCVLVLF